MGAIRPATLSPALNSAGVLGPPAPHHVSMAVSSTPGKTALVRTRLSQGAGGCSCATSIPHGRAIGGATGRRLARRSGLGFVFDVDELEPDAAVADPHYAHALDGCGLGQPLNLYVDDAADGRHFALVIHQKHTAIRHISRLDQGFAALVPNLDRGAERRARMLAAFLHDSVASSSFR